MNTQNINRNKYIKNVNDLIVNNDRIPNEFINSVDINSAISGDTLAYNGSNWVNSPLTWDEVVTDNPINGQTLIYENPNWINGFVSLSNLSGIDTTNPQNNELLRAQAPDLNLVNVNYALSNLTDVSLSGDIDNTLLKYSGSNYVNTSLAFREPAGSIQISPSSAKTIRIGCNDHGTQLGHTDCINIGINAGLINQGCNCISIGSNVGSNNQGCNSIIIGRALTGVSVGIDSVVIESDLTLDNYKFGDKNTVIGSRNTNSVAIPNGITAFGYCNLANACNATYLAIGSIANHTSTDGILFGYDSGNLNTASIQIGDNNSRLNSTGVSNIAIGGSINSACNNSISIGRSITPRGIHSINIGHVISTTGSVNADYSIAIGLSNFQTDRQNYNIGIGSNAANKCTSINNICIGISAGSNVLNERTINIGNLAGQCNPGTYGINIGYACYSTAPNSILLNASKNVFSKTTTGLFIAPGTIQGSNVDTNSGELYYIPSTGEIKYATL